MTFRKFLSLLLGTALVLGAAGVGLVYTYGRAHTLHAREAVVESDISTVGTPFGGSIKSIAVRPGDHVSAGQEILRLQSATLQQALDTARFSPEGVGYHIEGDDVMVFTATAEGTVGRADHAVGSFVPANTEIATIEVAGTSRITARVPMTATDFARLPLGAPMTAVLPDRTEITAEVFDVQFDESTGATGDPVAVVRARSTDLDSAGTFTNGAPVEAEIRLDDAEGLGSWAARQLTELVTPNGATL